MTVKKVVTETATAQVAPTTTAPTDESKPSIESVVPTTTAKTDPIPVQPANSAVSNPLHVPEVPIKSVEGVKLMNTSGKEVNKDKYFFEGIILPSFEKTCGNPVDREDLLEVFNKIFKPKDNILFYRQADKEVYIVIIPLKYSTSIGENNNSITGDFQKHALSFLNEGQVNLEALRAKLEKVKTFVKYDNR